jgi:hypothetical protein
MQVTNTAGNALFSGFQAFEQGWFTLFGRWSTVVGASVAQGFSSFGAGTIGGVGYGYTMPGTALPMANVFSIVDSPYASIRSRNNSGFTFDVRPGTTVGYDIQFWAWSN